MEDNDDDYFSDDGLDLLPPGTLLQLEKDAIARRTQQQTLHVTSGARNDTPLLQNDFVNQSVYGGNTLDLPQCLQPKLTGECGNLEMGELDAEVLDGDDQSVFALEQQPLTGTGANESHLQPYYLSEDIQQDVSRSALGHAAAGNRKRPTLPDPERMEVEEEHDVEPEFDDGAFHGLPNGMEELATRIEEVRVVLFA